MLDSLFKGSSGNIFGNISTESSVGFFLGSDLGLSLGSFLDLKNRIPVGLQVLLESPPGSKSRYTDF